MSYSIIKGHFLYQTGPEELVSDPLFGFSFLGGVDLVDLDLLNSATLLLPGDTLIDLEDYGDSWSLLESYETEMELDEAYPWGDYTLSFDSKTEGPHSCLIGIPETPLPPTPRLTNFADVQTINPSQPLTLNWEFDALPAADDFVQMYVNLGHGEVFSTPNQGEPGALTIHDRSVTIPADTLVAGYIHSLNLEVTRVTSVNSECYPDVQGYGAVFRSTSVDLFVMTPPVLRFLSRSGNELPEIEVVADPEGTVVLQGSPNLQTWSNIATNTSSSGTHVFRLPPETGADHFFRAFQN